MIHKAPDYALGTFTTDIAPGQLLGKDVKAARVSRPMQKVSKKILQFSVRGAKS